MQSCQAPYLGCGRSHVISGFELQAFFTFNSPV
jgi:hypothetical protein